MAIQPIIIAPDSRLKIRCRPVVRVDDIVRALMDDLVETMYAAPGVGLAAPQIGVDLRVLVTDIGRAGAPRRPLKMANPEIVWRGEEFAFYEEGCLSFPEHFAEVARPACVRVRYIDETDAAREIEAEGLLATCVQHEMDHLEGILFVEYISSLKRNIILRKLRKLKRSEAEVSV